MGLADKIVGWMKVFMDGGDPIRYVRLEAGTHGVTYVDVSDVPLNKLDGVLDKVRDEFMGAAKELAGFVSSVPPSLPPGQGPYREPDRASMLEGQLRHQTRGYAELLLERDQLAWKANVLTLDNADLQKEVQFLQARITKLSNYVNSHRTQFPMCPDPYDDHVVTTP